MNHSGPLPADLPVEPLQHHKDPRAPLSLGTTDCVSSHTTAPCFLADPWGQLAPFVPMCQQLLCCFKVLARPSRLWANVPVSSRDAKAPYHSTAAGRRARGSHSRFT
ncbi:hypothetical protein Nmel_005415 [Mimus melanotis]